MSSEEATSTQTEAVDSIIRNATQQALDLMSNLGEDKDSFRKLGLTFEEKAFYDILMHLRDKYIFDFGEDKKIGNLIVNNKCKLLAQKVKLHYVCNRVQTVIIHLKFVIKVNMTLSLDGIIYNTLK